MTFFNKLFRFFFRNGTLIEGYEEYQYASPRNAEVVQMGNEVANLYDSPDNARALSLVVANNGALPPSSGLGQQFPSINPVVQGKCYFLY